MTFMTASDVMKASREAQDRVLARFPGGAGGYYRAAIPYLQEAQDSLYGPGAVFDLSVYGGQPAGIWQQALRLSGDYRVDVAGNGVLMPPTNAPQAELDLAASGANFGAFGEALPPPTTGGAWGKVGGLGLVVVGLAVVVGAVAVMGARK